MYNYGDVHHIYVYNYGDIHHIYNYGDVIITGTYTIYIYIIYEWRRPLCFNNSTIIIQKY